SYVGRSKIAGSIHHQESRAIVACAEGVHAVADVLRAAIPEIAEVEYRIHHAGGVAAAGPARLNALAGIGRVRIREHRINDQIVLLNAAGVARRRTDYAAAGRRRSDRGMYDANTVGRNVMTVADGRSIGQPGTLSATVNAH